MPNKKDDEAAVAEAQQDTADLLRQRDALQRRVNMLEESEARLKAENEALTNEVNAAKQQRDQALDELERAGVKLQDEAVDEPTEVGEDEIAPGVKKGEVLPPGIMVRNGRLINGNGQLVDKTGRVLKR